MNPKELIQHLGMAERSAASQKLLRLFKMPKWEMQLTQKVFHNPKLGISLVYRDIRNFEHYYGPVNGPLAGSKYFLEEINFGDYYNSKAYPYPFPFDLKMGDTPAMVQQKMNRAPAEKSVAFASYYADGVRLMAWFDEKKKLYEFKIKPIEWKIKSKLKSKVPASFIPLNKDGLLKLKDQLPVIRWEKRMVKGDSKFNKTNLRAMANLLNGFIGEFVSAAGKKSEVDVPKSIAKLVKKINTLNKKSFIETMEREELVTFLHKVVRTAGYKIIKGDDLTEKVREW